MKSLILFYVILGISWSIVIVNSICRTGEYTLWQMLGFGSRHPVLAFLVFWFSFLSVAAIWPYSLYRNIEAAILRHYLK